MACSVIRNDDNTIKEVLAPNGVSSSLYNNLKTQIKDPEKALLMWAKAYTPSFEAKFGPWQTYERVYNTDPSNGLILDPLAYLADKLDENKEPKVEFVLGNITSSSNLSETGKINSINFEMSNDDQQYYRRDFTEQNQQQEDNISGTVQNQSQGKFQQTLPSIEELAEFRRENNIEGSGSDSQLSERVPEEIFKSIQLDNSSGIQSLYALANRIAGRGELQSNSFNSRLSQLLYKDFGTKFYIEYNSKNSVFSANEKYVFINAAKLDKFINKFNSYSDFIKGTELVLSEELIHSALYNIMTVSEYDKVFKELTKSDIDKINEIYNFDKNDKNYKTNLVQEYLRMLLQNKYFNTISEIETKKSVREIISKIVKFLKSKLLNTDNYTNKIIERFEGYLDGKSYQDQNYLNSLQEESEELINNYPRVILPKLKPKFNTNTANVENVLYNLANHTIVKQGARTVERNILSKIKGNYYISSSAPNYDYNTNINANITEYNYKRFKDRLKFHNISESNFVIKEVEVKGTKRKMVLMNPNQVQFDAIQENFLNQSVDTLVDHLAEKFNIQDKVVRISKKEFRDKFPGYPGGVQSAIVNGTLYLFNNTTAEIATEELLHFFTFTLQKHNPALFTKLLSEATNNYPFLVEEVYANYLNLFKDSPHGNAQIQNEIVTKALVRNYIEVSNEGLTNKSAFKEFGIWFTKLVGEILEYFGFTRINASELNIANDLNTLARLLNTDIRIDVDSNVTFDLFSYKTGLKDVLDRLPLLYAKENILKNNKTFTLREQNYSEGKNYVEYLEGTAFVISNQGKVNLEEAILLTGKTKDQLLNDFTGAQEFTDINPKVKAWFEGKGRLYFYDITRTPQDQLDVSLGMSDNDIRFEEEIIKIEQKINILRSRLKGANTPERKEIIRTSIKRLEKEIEAYEETETNSINKAIELLKTTFEDFQKYIEEYKANPRQQDVDFLNSTITGWNNFLNKFSKTPEQLAEIRVYLDGMIGLYQDLQQVLINKYAATPEVEIGLNILDASGEIIASEDISGTTTLVQSTIDNNKNKLVALVGKRLKQAKAAALRITSEFIGRFSSIEQNFIKFQKSQGLDSSKFYDMFLQIDKNKKKTGYYVIKEGLAYQDELKSFTTEIEKWKFLAKTNKITFNQDVFDEIIDNKEKYIREKQGFDINNDYDNKSAQRYASKKGLEVSDLKLNPGEVDYEALVQLKVDREITKIKAQLNSSIFNSVMDKFKNNITLTKTEKQWFNNFKDKKNNYFIDYNSYKLKKGVFSMELTDTQYIDAKWEFINNLPESDPRKQFYNIFTKEINSARVKLYGDDIHVPKNYIPAFYPEEKIDGETTKEFWQRKVRDGFIDEISERLEDNIHGIDPSTGEIIKKIPMYSLTYIDPTEKSYDLSRVLKQFVGEFADFTTKSAIEDEVLLIREIVKKQKVYMQDSKGKILVIDGVPQYKSEGKGSNNFIQLENYINASMYGDHYDKEGKVNDNKYLKTFDKKKTEELEEIIKSSPLTEARKRELYTDYTLNPTVVLDESILTSQEIEVIVAGRQLELLKSGQSMTWKKVVNSLMKFTSLKVLGLSPLSALYEGMQGTGALWTEAASGKHFNDSHAGFAFKYYTKSFMDGNEKIKMEKLQNLYGVHGNFSQEVQGGGKVSKTAFWFMGGARKIVNSQFLLAILKSKTLEIQGNKISLLDIIDFTGDGKAIVNDKYKNDISQETLDTQITDTQILYLEVINQNRDRDSSTDQILFNRKSLYRSIGMFKFSWMVQGINKRFASENENLITGNRKGFYRSFGNLFTSEYEDVDIQGNVTTRSKFTPLKGLQRLVAYTKLGKRLVSKQGKVFDDISLSELDEQNIGRAVRELSIALTFFALYTILGAIRPGGDDPDEEDKESMAYRTNIFLTNLFTRNFRDFALYIDPSSARNTLRNAIPISQTLQDFLGVGEAVWDTVLGDPYVYEDTKKEQLRIPKSVIKVVPFVNQVPNTWKKLTTEAKQINF